MFSKLPSRLKINHQSEFRKRLPEFFPWLLLLLTYSAAVFFQAKYCDDLLNSDMAAEMLLAKELNDSGSILFAKNWFYSTEIRVLYQHIPFRLGLLLFPDNWRLARALGQAIMLALHGGSFIYLMSSLGHKKAGIYGAAALMCPFGFWYTFYGVYSGMYLTHMILFSITLALFFRIQQVSRQKGVLLVLTLAILCFLQGMGGVRMLMNLFVPLFLTFLILLALQFNVKPFKKPFFKDPLVKLSILSVFSSGCCAVGYLFNSLVLSKNYSFTSFEGHVWQSFSISQLLETWSEFLTLFGYPYVEFAQWISSNGWTDIPLLSTRGILGSSSIILIIVLLLSIFRLFKIGSRLSIPCKIISLLLPFCLLVSGVSYSCLSSTTSDLKANGSYWLPLVPLAFATVTVWIINEDFRLPRLYKGSIGAALLLCIFCTSLTSSYQFINYPPRAAIKMKAVGQWLMDNGYTQGYATFWNSDVLTEHTNGKVEMWTLADPTSHTISPWLQVRDHLDRSPEGKCFVLLEEYEYKNNIDSLPYRIDDDTIVFNEYDYIILSYDSIEDALK